jgi:hypothetical protein
MERNLNERIVQAQRMIAQDEQVAHWEQKTAQWQREIRRNEMVRTWALYTATGTLAACYMWALLNYFVQTFGTTLFMYMAYWAGKFIVEVVIKKTFMGGEDE